MATLQEQLATLREEQAQIAQRLEEIRELQRQQQLQQEHEQLAENFLSAQRTLLHQTRRQAWETFLQISDIQPQLQQAKEARATIRTTVEAEHQQNNNNNNNQDNQATIDAEVARREADANTNISNLETQLNHLTNNFMTFSTRATSLSEAIKSQEQSSTAANPGQLNTALASPIHHHKPRAPPANLPIFDPASNDTNSRDPRAFLNVYKTTTRAAAATPEEQLRWFGASLTPLVMRNYNSVFHTFTNIKDAEAWLISRYNSNNELRDVHNELLTIRLQSNESGIVFGDRFSELLDLCNISHSGPLDENTAALYINAMPPTISFELSKLKGSLKTVEDYVAATGNIMHALKRARKPVFPHYWPSTSTSPSIPSTTPTTPTKPPPAGPARSAKSANNRTTRYNPYPTPTSHVGCRMHNTSDHQFSDAVCHQLLQQQPDHQYFRPLPSPFSKLHDQNPQQDHRTAHLSTTVLKHFR
ncbi:hypothetical protein HK102_013099 [Quaeritorhiza haematococci]|nr:hypothetical protein HK102_013099 [Quaeritorhiza haematococci]